MNKEKLTELVYINLGRASMCWSEIPRGVFDSTKAAELGQEIMDAIEKYVEEDKEPGGSGSLADYLKDEIAKYKDVPTVAVNKESEWQKRRRLEAMKTAVVSDTPVSSWMNEYREEYYALLTSGMMFEFYPTFTGGWDHDKYAFCHHNRFKKGNAQDSAHYSSREITVEEIHQIHKEMMENERNKETEIKYSAAIDQIRANKDYTGLDDNGNPTFRYRGIYYTLDKDFKKILEEKIEKPDWWWNDLEPK